MLEPYSPDFRLQLGSERFAMVRSQPAEVRSGTLMQKQHGYRKSVSEQDRRRTAP